MENTASITTAQRIESVKNYAAARQATETQLQIAARKEHEQKLASLATYGERIGAMLDVATALVRNGIHLGKPKSRGVSGALYPKFVTDGICHQFGFRLERPFYLFPYNNASPLSGGIPDSVGFEGGGWNGQNFFVNRHGTVIEGANHPRFNSLYESFINNFNTFEKSFYDWVDHLQA